MTGDAHVESLRAVAEELESELGRAPTSRELLRLLTYGARALEDRLEGTDASALTGLTARYRTGARPAKVDETDGLNDAAWEQAVAFAVDLADSLDAPVTVEAFTAAVLAVIHAAGRGVLSDVDPAELIALKAQRARRTGPRPRVGDIAAVTGTNYRAIVVLLINRADTAFGILDRDDEPALEHPLLSDAKEIRNGHWPIVGHDPALVARFPTPERFHRPPGLAGTDLGEHGAAESLDSKRLRLLTAEQAHRADLDRGDFRQFHLSPYLANWLVKRLG
jgi:hypothetical protein